MPVAGIVREVSTVFFADPHHFPQIVPEDSAVLDGFGVKKISVPANHTDMCKFSNSQDAGYRRISDQIMAYIGDMDGLDASSSPDETQSPPPEYEVVHRDDPSSQPMTISLNASTSPGTEKYVVIFYDFPSGRSSHITTVSPDASTSPDRKQSPQEYVVVHYDVRFSHN